ncbi:MAG TPA: sulfite exporter TauE/SafE family protein [Panacibacter sp.]|nr:sulfite exporter TauE/SafE family protein [Panacibacter sp.]
MELVGYFFSVIIGISLGLIGGGGSILTVPILVYLFHINPHQSTSYSLFIVGITALFGAYTHYKLGNLKIKPALLFGVPSLISLLIVRKVILPEIPVHLFTVGNLEISKDLLIMTVFAMLMVAASASMIIKTKEKIPEMPPKPFRLSVIGLVVGLVTGFLGAGGGFLIIPALIFFAGLSMKQSVGTSLLIIAFNSLFGFGGDIINGVKMDYPFLFTLSAVAVFGIFIGIQISKKIDGDKLKPAFGWFVLVMGIYIIIKEIFFTTGI